MMSTPEIRVAHLGQLIEVLQGSDDVPTTTEVEEICEVITDLVRAVPFEKMNWTVEQLRKCLTSIDFFEDGMAKKAMEQKVEAAIAILDQLVRPKPATIDPSTGRPQYVKFPNGKMP